MNILIEAFVIALLRRSFDVATPSRILKPPSIRKLNFLIVTINDCPEDFTILSHFQTVIRPQIYVCCQKRPTWNYDCSIKKLLEQWLHNLKAHYCHNNYHLNSEEYFSPVGSDAPNFETWRKNQQTMMRFADTSTPPYILNGQSDANSFLGKRTH